LPIGSVNYGLCYSLHYKGNCAWTLKYTESERVVERTTCVSLHADGRTGSAINDGETHDWTARQSNNEMYSVTRWEISASHRRWHCGDCIWSCSGVARHISFNYTKYRQHIQNIQNINNVLKDTKIKTNIPTKHRKTTYIRTKKFKGEARNTDNILKLERIIRIFVHLLLCTREQMHTYNKEIQKKKQKNTYTRHIWEKQKPTAFAFARHSYTSK